MAIRPPFEADEVVTVRLSEVPQKLRLEAASVLIKKMGLETYAAIELSMAAAAPVEDPSIEVSAEKAARVLAGKFPVGAFPVFD
jgi:hypothetical protein